MIITRSYDESSDREVFELEGRLDTITSPELQSELIPAFETRPNILIDMKKLAYVSSAGLRVLLLAQKTAAAKDGSLTLKNVSGDIMEVFEITGFSELLTIE